MGPFLVAKRLIRSAPDIQIPNFIKWTTSDSHRLKTVTTIPCRLLFEKPRRIELSIKEKYEVRVSVSFAPIVAEL